MNRRLPPLRPLDLFAIPVIIIMVVWDVVKHVVDPDTPAALLPQRIALIVVITLLSFAVLWIFFLLIRKRWSNSGVVTALLVAIAVVAIIKGYVWAWTLVQIGAFDEPSYAFRIGASLTHMTVAVVVLWAAMTGIRLHYERISEIEAERRQLEILRAETRNQLASLDEEATEAVRAKILAGLTAAPSADAPSVLQRLNRTIDKVVRPLSRQLESESDHWLPPPADNQPVRINWITAIREGADPALISPTVICFFFLWLGAPLSITRGGWLFLLEFVFMLTVVAFPLLWIGRRLGIRLTKHRPGWTRALLFVAILTISGLIFGVSLRIFSGHFPTPWMFAYLGPIFALLSGSIWALAVSAHRQARATEAAAAQSSADLRWSITRARELHRQRRRALAHAVHGQVQASLAAAILQLDNALRDGTASEEAVTTIQGRVIDSVVNLDMRGMEPSPIDDVLAKTGATWAGVADIELTIDPSLEAELWRDPQTLMTLNDIIPELVFNSIKHGKARNIGITVAQDTARTLTVVVTDDGRTTAEEPISGLGSRLLDDCAMRWNRQRSENKTVTEVVLTLAVEENVAAHVA
jgi:two-component sensor histidine kinase